MLIRNWIWLDALGQKCFLGLWVSSRSALLEGFLVLNSSIIFRIIRSRYNPDSALLILVFTLLNLDMNFTAGLSNETRLEISRLDLDLFPILLYRSSCLGHHPYGR